MADRSPFLCPHFDQAWRTLWTSWILANTVRKFHFFYLVRGKGKLDIKVRLLWSVCKICGFARKVMAVPHCNTSPRKCLNYCHWFTVCFCHSLFHCRSFKSASKGLLGVSCAASLIWLPLLSWKCGAYCFYRTGRWYLLPKETTCAWDIELVWSPSLVAEMGERKGSIVFDVQLDQWS